MVLCNTKCKRKQCWWWHTFHLGSNSPCSPLTRRNQNVLAVLYWQEYSPECLRFFSSRFKGNGLPFVAVTTQLYICLSEGSKQVKTPLLWFGGNVRLPLMCRSPPTKAMNTVLSSSISARGHDIELKNKAGMMNKQKLHLSSTGVSC